MSSKAKQVLLWLMIISSAMLFVWFLQSKQTKPPADLSFDAALMQIKNKDIKEAVIKSDSLELTNKKFIQRFTKMEEMALNNRKQLNEMTLEEMDDLWNTIKKQNK